MFTGLIEEVGKIKQVSRHRDSMKLAISCHKVLEGTHMGDSIAVNGVCLTVTEIGANYFAADVMPETMNKTNLRFCSPNTSVNLERSLTVGQRMGGHFVQGHVDGVASLEQRNPYENAVMFRFRVLELTHYMVKKGSIAVNGISLTLVEVGCDFFTVSIIPHTLKETQMQFAKQGDLVNIEVDMIGKYVAKWVGKQNFSSSSLTIEKMMQQGFL